MMGPGKGISELSAIAFCSGKQAARAKGPVQAAAKTEVSCCCRGDSTEAGWELGGDRMESFD